MLKSTGASAQPCLTPLPTLNGSDSCPSTVTLALIPLWNYSMIFTHLLGHSAGELFIEGHEQILIFFPAHFLQLVCGKDHVHSTSALSEATVGF